MVRKFRGLATSIRAKRYLKWRVLAIAFIAFILFSRLAVWFILGQTNLQTAQQNFNMDTAMQVSKIQDQFEIYANTLYAARALFSTGTQVSRQSWETFIDTQKLQERYPAIYAMAYISAIHKADVGKLTAQLNADRLSSETDPIVIHPQITGDSLAVVTYIAPATVPQNIIGTNVLADANRAKALAEARNSGLPHASRPLTLAVDSSDAQPSILMVLPIYAPGAESLLTTAQRQAAIQGYAVAVLRTKPMLDDIFVGSTASGFAVSISTSGQTIYHNGPNISGMALEKHQDISVAGQTWTLDFKAPTGYGLSPVSKIAPTALTLSALPFIFVLVLILYFATQVYHPEAQDQRRKSD